jgi:hypothetical protein
MRAVDTNVLVRLVTRDDRKQVAAAESFVSKGAWVHAGNHGSDRGSYSGVRPESRGNRDGHRDAFASSRTYHSRVRWRGHSTRTVSQPPSVGILRLFDPSNSAESRHLPLGPSTEISPNSTEPKDCSSVPLGPFRKVACTFSRLPRRYSPAGWRCGPRASNRVNPIDLS